MAFSENLSADWAAINSAKVGSMAFVLSASAVKCVNVLVCDPYRKMVVVVLSLLSALAITRAGIPSFNRKPSVASVCKQDSTQTTWCSKRAQCTTFKLNSDRRCRQRATLQVAPTDFKIYQRTSCLV